MVKKDLDDFWDLSSLVPKKSKNTVSTYRKEPIEIANEYSSAKKDKADSNNDSVIVRYITPNKASEKLERGSSLETVCTYTPHESLIHSVTVKKWKTSYNYYGNFLKNAIEYIDIKGYECEYVPFFSYVPQYDQMSEEQLKYYFWFRENERNGKHIKTDSCYLFLYIYELLNLGKRLDTKQTQRTLTELWNEYHDEFPMISSKLSGWICDYSLRHMLPPPENAKREMIQAVSSLKEFYIKLPMGDMEKCARSLIRYCSSYDFRTSKFINEGNKDLFEKMMVGSLAQAIRFYSAGGELLSGLKFGDSVIERDVYAGAVCVSEEKYKIEVRYCSFSRSNELRFLVGDIIKYSENKLRAYMGIKSRMTVYSVSVELRNVLDEFFESNLPVIKPALKVKKREEKHDYDILYDVPNKKLSLADAAKIEEESWETTRELIDAFEAVDAELEVMPVSVERSLTETVADELRENSESGLERYKSILKELINGNKKALLNFASSCGKMTDALVDEINEVAYDEIGDAIIEDDGMGNYVFIEDYKYLFE